MGSSAVAAVGTAVRLRPVEEHRARALSLVEPLPPRWVDLLEAQGCVVAVDVDAPGPLPAFDASAMDGYAVRWSDVAPGGEAGGPSDGDPGAGDDVDLPVVADLPAGARRADPLAAGTAARIMTGAPVPAGADAVVPVEWTDGWAPADGSGHVRIGGGRRRDVRPGLHVRRTGEGVRAGERLLDAGAQLGPRQLALLAATGHGRVLVRPTPLVAVLSTGDELVEPGDPVGFGQVNDVNSLSLVAAARAAGVRAVRVGHVRDDGGSLLGLLRRAVADGADVLVTSGGVSAGAYDVVKEVLEPLGSVEFTKVAMQPGMPQGLGTLDGVPVFTLPGNPVSAWLSFEVFVRPVLARLRGLPDDHPDASLPSAVLPAGEAWSSPAGKLQFTRAVLRPRVAPGGGVEPAVHPVGGPGSHLVGDLAVATHLALVPQGVTRVEPGDPLTCLLLDPGA